MHNLSFTTLLKMIECKDLPSELQKEYEPWKTFGFTQIKEGIGSTHQGFLEHIPRTSRVNNTSSKVDHG